MRLLWVGHFVPWPLTGGSLIRSHHLIREVARDWDVFFLGFNQPALLPEGPALDEARRVLLGSCRGVRVVPLRSTEGGWSRALLLARSLLARSYDETWLKSAAMRAALREEVRSFRPDVVHFDTVGLAQYAGECASLPLVLNHHNVESQMMRRRAEVEPRRTAARYLRIQAARLAHLEKTTAKRFAMHLVVSALDGERLATIVPGVPWTVIPNGVDLDYFRPDVPKREVVPRSAVFVGGLNWYPNRSAVAWFLDRVYPLVRAACPELTFTVVGKSPPRALEDSSREAEGVVVAGEVEDVRPFLARSAAFVCPMFEGGGTRLKILTAMAQGIPIVATPMAVEGIPMRDGDHALLAERPEDFAAALLRIFREPALAAGLGARARALAVEEYGWDTIGKRLRAVYAASAGRTEKPCAASSPS